MTGRRAVSVVGGSGFLGGHLVAALRCKGLRVSVFDRGSPAIRDGWAAPEIDDVATVFYVAGGATPLTAESQPERLRDELAMFVRLLGAAGRGAVRARVVLASSGGTIYAPTAVPPYRETDPVCPNNAYGAFKLQMEQALFAQPGIEPVAVRLSNVYGPGQRLRGGLGVVAHWLDALKRGEAPVLHGDPAATRDFLYVDDAVDLFVRVHSAVRPPSLLNAGSGVPTSLAELAGVMAEVTGKRQRWELRRQGRAPDRLHCHLCVDRACETLGWTPATTLREGVRRTWLSLDSRLSLVR
ncbi:NAD-dependent epimerase/dehydratase family protein [Dactylosporangium darangshiense]|uniref:NAD-dependent epimerase/dehydratase family protein n=1 Tax=Dactylosporangium darangshiense TaxID=579108 RepID=A0ABP8DUE3_9ACTN